jgi:DNA-binding MarR family transcriptional regulator
VSASLLTPGEVRFDCPQLYSAVSEEQSRRGVLARHRGRGEAVVSIEQRSDALDLEQQVCYALSIAARGVVATYKPLLAPLGLTHPQYLAMVALWQHGPLQVKDLGSLLSLDSGTLSPLLKRLDAMGLVRRERSPLDERLVTVTLTERGEDLRSPAQEVHQGVVRRLGLDKSELENLQTVLRRLTRATGAATSDDNGDDSADATGEDRTGTAGQ